MAVDRSRYYHGPTKAVVGQETPGYAYASIFLKKRDEAWQMAQKQAASEIAQGDTRYKLLMDAYQARASDLDDRMKALDKSIADAAGDNTKALNAATIQQSKNALTDAKQKADWEIAKKATVAVAQPSSGGSKSYSEGSSSGGGGGDEYKKGLGSISDDADEFIGTQKALVGDDPLALARGVESAPEGAGFVSVSDPKSARDLRYRTVSTSVDAAAAKVLKDNPDLDPADAILVAESEVLGKLKAGGMGDYAAAYSAVKSAATPAPGEGGTSSRVSESSSWRSGGGAVQKLRNPGLGDAPVGTPEQLPVALVNTADLTQARKDLQAEIDKLKPPEMSQSDWITRSREIMAGRFGPVQATPNFYQRNIAQGIQANLDNPVVQEVYKAWKASLPAPEAGSPEAPVRIKGPGPENYSAAAMAPATPEAVAEAERAIAAVPPGASAVPSVSPVDAPLAPPAAAERVLEVEAARRQAADARQAELSVLFPDGVPPELRPPTPSFVPQVSTMKEPVIEAAPVPSPVPPVRVGFEPAPLGEKPSPTEEFKAEAKAPVRVPSKITYYQNRVEEAVKLSGQPDKLARLSASGAGKTARDIYRANAAAGQPFTKTYEELTLTFAGNEDALKAAHAVALALDMKARKSTEPPKE